MARNPELVTIVGSMPYPNPGKNLRLGSEWIINGKHGRQFRVESCLSVLPSTLTGIESTSAPGW